MNQNLDNHQADALALFNTAFDHHKNGKYQQAEEIYHHLLLHTKDNWFLHFNFGLLLLETNRHEEALHQLLTAASLNSSSNDLYYHLALCQKRCGLLQQAVQSYHCALDLDQDDTESLYNLAGCYHHLALFQEALGVYERLLRKVPDHQSALNNSAYISHKIGQFDRARGYYKRLLDVNPDHTSAEHMFAALSGEPRSTAPLSYIQEVFDDYSSIYEQSLVGQLEYNLPTRLHSLVTLLSDNHLFTRILDLGCGTGLIGEAFKNSAATLDGIDLSSRMIAIADSKDIYDQLMTTDIKSGLNHCKTESYDLILAADVFTYIGEIADIMQLAHRVGTPDCLFCFSVEGSDSQTAGMVLRKSGRFAHSRSYIKQTAHAAGWDMIHEETVTLRKERDGWVTGVVHAMKKSIT